MNIRITAIFEVEVEADPAEYADLEDLIIATRSELNDRLMTEASHSYMNLYEDELVEFIDPNNGRKIALNDIRWKGDT